MSDLGFKSEEDIVAYSRREFEKALSQSVHYANDRIVEMEAKPEEFRLAMEAVYREAALACYESMYQELKLKISRTIYQDESAIKIYEELNKNNQYGIGLSNSQKTGEYS